MVLQNAVESSRNENANEEEEQKPEAVKMVAQGDWSHTLEKLQEQESALCCRHRRNHFRLL